MIKPYTCWNCKQIIEKPTKATRGHCSRCGSKYWEAPSLGTRLRWAWKAFNWKPRKQIRRLSREEVLTTMPETTMDDIPEIANQAYMEQLKEGL